MLYQVITQLQPLAMLPLDPFHTIRDNPQYALYRDQIVELNGNAMGSNIFTNLRGLRTIFNTNRYDIKNFTDNINEIILKLKNLVIDKLVIFAQLSTNPATLTAITNHPNKNYNTDAAVVGNNLTLATDLATIASRADNFPLLDRILAHPNHNAASDVAANARRATLLEPPQPLLFTRPDSELTVADDSTSSSSPDTDPTVSFTSAPSQTMVNLPPSILQTLQDRDLGLGEMHLPSRLARK